jgi:hypothetical protein
MGPDDAVGQEPVRCLWASAQANTSSSVSLGRQDLVRAPTFRVSSFARLSPPGSPR